VRLTSTARTQAETDEPPEQEAIDESARRELEAAAPEADAARLDAVLDAEAIDSAWADTAHRQLKQSLSNAVAGVHVDEVSCRATVCRVELSYDNEERAQLLDLEQIAESLPWESQGAAMKLTGANGRQYAVVYVSREGHPLPLTRDEGGG
jgi:hypothetical protein